MRVQIYFIVNFYNSPILLNEERFSGCKKVSIDAIGLPCYFFFIRKKCKRNMVIFAKSFQGFR